MKRIIFILLLALLPACSEKPTTKNLFSDEALKGAANGVTATVVEVQEGKPVKGGVLVTANAFAPLDVSQEQLRPTLLKTLRALKGNLPDVEWFEVYLFNDKRMVDCGSYVARAELKEGVVYLTGGIPSEQELKAAVREGESAITKPTDKEREICSLYSKVRREIRKTSNDWKGEPARVYAAVSKQTGISPKKVERIRNAVMGYYNIKMTDPL